MQLHPTCNTNPDERVLRAGNPSCEEMAMKTAAHLVLAASCLPLCAAFRASPTGAAPRLRAASSHARLHAAGIVCAEDYKPPSSFAEDWEAAGRKDSLEADIARLKAAKAAELAASGVTGEEEPGMLDKTIDTLGTVLTYNFFIIITFFTWFLAGCFAQFGLKSYALINAFRGAWDVIIMPLLTTHMTLTFLSYGLEKAAGRDEA